VRAEYIYPESRLEKGWKASILTNRDGSVGEQLAERSEHRSFMASLLL
jgi:hypothetical protein